MKLIIKLLLIGLPVVASVSLSSCQNTSSEAQENFDYTQFISTDSPSLSDTLTTEISAEVERGVVLERVQDIYSLIKQECTYMGGSIDSDLLDKAYCSESWNQLLMAVRRQEYLTNTLFFEVNHWTMSHDTDLVNFDEFQVRNLVISEDEKRAQVDFTVYEPDNYIPARVELVFEDGQWKIDNFYHLKYMFNLRERMWEFLDDQSMSFLL
ncbi:MAG: hypothetical protein J5502_07530 [Prevotella sp.]|nr:hypothetical protein [Prevotella sp.]